MHDATAASMPIELFNVQYSPGLNKPPVNLLCQSIDVDGEKLLWLDGINLEDPVLAPLSAMRHYSWMGSFKEFAAQRLDEARMVFEVSQGEHTPSILARAMLYLSADPKLNAAEAIELATDQALDILDADSYCASLFSLATSGQPTAQYA
jgi:hypothetical protein